MFRIILLFFTVLIVVGCARYPPADDGFVSSLVATNTEQQVEWFQNYSEEQFSSCSIQHLLEKELTPQAAIQIAFLKNPKIQAIFEELGIAHADLIEAGLLTNPNFSLEVRYPSQHGFVTNIEYLVTTAFLDIFIIPLRKKVAAAEFEQVKRKVTHEILTVAFDVRQIYYELIAEQQKLSYLRNLEEVIGIQSELVSRQHLAGNINSLDFQQMQARHLEAKLEVDREQVLIILLMEKFNRLLGLSQEHCLILPTLPQEMDDQSFVLDTLEALALNERMDLQALRFEMIRLCRMIGLKAWWTYTDLQAGLAGEREPDGLNLLGFGLSGDIPIFNYGQATRRRMMAQLRQTRDRYAALEIQILSEVRESYKILIQNLAMLHDYRLHILPVQRDILNSSEELYNVMGLGIDRLLEYKRHEIEISRNYIEILRDYWVARVQLDRALGRFL